MNLTSLKEGELKPVVNLLEEAFQHLGIDYYLIGAYAKAVWYSATNKQIRQTKDIDFAVLVGSQQEYERLKTYLLDNHKFQLISYNTFGLRSNEGIYVDLLPFGDIEAEGNVVVNLEGSIILSVAGFSEVYLSGTEMIRLSEGGVFKVATLPAIVMLKLIAYDDRPEQRLKDADDISNILTHYFDLQAEIVYEFHSDLFSNENERELIEIAAIVIGREMKKIIGSTSKLSNRIESILKTEIALFEKSAFVRQMKINEDDTIRDRVALLNFLLIGFTD